MHPADNGTYYVKWGSANVSVYDPESDDNSRKGDVSYAAFYGLHIFFILTEARNRKDFNDKKNTQHL